MQRQYRGRAPKCNSLTSPRAIVLFLACSNRGLLDPRVPRVGDVEMVASVELSVVVTIGFPGEQDFWRGRGSPWSP